MSIPFLQTEGNEALHRLKISETVNLMLKGRGNSTGTFTLTANATTTTVTDPAFESSMVPSWTPTTAHAATAMTNLYVSARSKGSFTLTHANTADVDKTFLYTRRG